MLEGKSLNEFTHSVKRKLGIRPNKSLGQNFLISDSVRNKILGMIDDETGTIVEIGGGLGALSIPLAMRDAKLIVYEKDDVLREWLEKELKYHNKNVVVKGDFLDEYPLKGLIDSEFVVAGNIPYQITSPILERIYDAPQLPGDVILMLQKEVAQRIDAKPGTKARGRLTIWCEYHAEVVSSFNVGAGSFYPQPDVDSRVIKLRTRVDFKFDSKSKKKFFSMVKLSFSMKRKTLANNLKGWKLGVDKNQVESAIEGLGLDKRIRAEGMSLKHFIELFEKLGS